MLSVYADDSSDEKCERIYAIAGVMGTQEEWDALKVEWVQRTDGIIFHATDCESGRGDYKNIPSEQRHRLIKDLIQILAQSNMMGIGYAIDIEGYKTAMSDALEDAPYFQCFVGVVLEFVKLARIIIPQQKVKFIFDTNPKTKFNSAFLYDNYLASRSGYDEYTAYMEDEIGFATSRSVGIQVADLFTRETMKHFDNQFGPINRRTRLSMEELLKTKRFECTYYHKDYFKDFKRKLELLEQKTGISQEGYKRWQLKHKCLDNAESRIRYAIYMESIKSSSSY